jgi:hypothetical protein
MDAHDETLVNSVETRYPCGEPAEDSSGVRGEKVWEEEGGVSPKYREFREWLRTLKPWLYPLGPAIRKAHLLRYQREYEARKYVPKNR